MRILRYLPLLTGVLWMSPAPAAAEDAGPGSAITEARPEIE